MHKPEPSYLIGNILFGIVLYRSQIGQSKTFSSLKSSALLSKTKPEVIFYDNSEEETGISKANQKEALELGCHYFSNPSNPGLSVAYNYFLEFAKKNGYKWLVLLDQDTILPESFLEVYGDASLDNKDSNKIKIPVVHSGHFILSPSKLIWGRNFLFTQVQPGNTPFKNLVFINSGLMIDIDFGLKLNGFNERLKLDFVDTEFCLRAKKETENFTVLPLELHQTFSHLEDSFESAKRRFKIFKSDLKALKKIRPGESQALNLNLILHTLKLCYKYRTFYFLYS